jgi:hypothetical protein
MPQCMLMSDIVTITKMTLANIDAGFVSNMKIKCLTMVEHCNAEGFCFDIFIK